MEMTSFGFDITVPENNRAQSQEGRKFGDTALESDSSDSQIGYSINVLNVDSLDWGTDSDSSDDDAKHPQLPCLSMMAQLHDPDLFPPFVCDTF